MTENPPLDARRLLDETFVAQVEQHDVLGSTNDRAKEIALTDGTVRPFLVVAERQTAGRGRGGNAWWTAPGSVAMSLLVGPNHLPDDPAHGPLVALATGLAVVRTVANRVPEHVVGIHWPNDVIVDGRKLSGILVEGLGPRGQVIGIGLNVNNSAAEAPDELRARAVSLRDLTGRTHDRTGLVIEVLRELARLLEELARDPDSIGRRAHAVCLQKGQTLAVQQGDQTLAGRCVGIAADGALVLDTPEGRRALVTGILRA
ncbi:MAG: biotin--[acetyl-CoA-carboxylase] ligase [Pirellulales bacterium]|nr:biotin--[acetyl-CoA-carboxylase] ligase [Pirellulales bacterium]